MIEVGKINLKFSNHIFEEFSNQLQEGYCYNNVFNLTKILRRDFLQGNLLLAFGYWGNPSKIVLRHGYIITIDNQIIDPTILFNGNMEIVEKASYFTFAKFTLEEHQKHINQIIKKHGEAFPDMRTVVFNKEKHFYNYAVKNNIPIFIESYNDYLKEFDSQHLLKVVDPSTM
jgi:hypothetical protein